MSSHCIDEKLNFIEKASKNTLYADLVLDTDQVKGKRKTCKKGRTPKCRVFSLFACSLKGLVICR